MDAGLGILGIGLFLITMIVSFARQNMGIAVAVALLAVVSTAMAVTDGPKRREVALGIGVALLGVEAAALVSGERWWIHVMLVVAAVSYILLWAEYRFPAFGRVPPEAVPQAHAPRILRGRGRGRGRQAV